MNIILDDSFGYDVELAMPAWLIGMSRPVAEDMSGKAKDVAAREKRDVLVLGPGWVNDKSALWEAVAALRKGYLTYACVTPTSVNSTGSTGCRNRQRRGS